MNKKSAKKLIRTTTIIAIVAVALAWVCSHFVHLGAVEWTDNAQVRRNLVPINSRVQGYVKRICFNDFEEVKAGDTLVIIDNSEYLLRVAQTNAAYRRALVDSTAMGTTISTTDNNLSVSDAPHHGGRVGTGVARHPPHHAPRLLPRPLPAVQGHRLPWHHAMERVPAQRALHWAVRFASRLVAGQGDTHSHGVRHRVARLGCLPCGYRRATFHTPGDIRAAEVLHHLVAIRKLLGIERHGGANTEHVHRGHTGLRHVPLHIAQLGCRGRHPLRDTLHLLRAGNEEMAPTQRGHRGLLLLHHVPGGTLLPDRTRDGLPPAVAANVAQGRGHGRAVRGAGIHSGKERPVRVLFPSPVSHRLHPHGRGNSGVPIGAVAPAEHFPQGEPHAAIGGDDARQSRDKKLLGTIRRTAKTVDDGWAERGIRHSRRSGHRHHNMPLLL